MSGIRMKPIRMWAIRPMDLGGQWLICDDAELAETLANMGEKDEIWEVKRWKDLTEKELKDLPEFDGW